MPNTKKFCLFGGGVASPRCSCCVNYCVMCYLQFCRLRSGPGRLRPAAYIIHLLAGALKFLWQPASAIKWISEWVWVKGTLTIFTVTLAISADVYLFFIINYLKREFKCWNKAQRIDAVNYRYYRRGETVLKCSFLFAFPHWELRSILCSINCYLIAWRDQMLIRLALTSTAARRVSLANDSVFMLTLLYWADPDWSVMLGGESECNAPHPPKDNMSAAPPWPHSALFLHVPVVLTVLCLCAHEL